MVYDGHPKSLQPRHFYTKTFFTIYIHQWNVHRLPTHVNIAAADMIWCRCNSWRHGALNRNDLKQARREEGGNSCPGPRDVWRGAPSLRNTKYTRMRHSSKKTFKIFSPGSSARMFPRVPLWLSAGLLWSAIALRRSVVCLAAASVHFEHSAHLLRALTAAGVDYRVQIYPDAPHAVIDVLASTPPRTHGGDKVHRHVLRTLRGFVQSHCQTSNNQRTSPRDEDKVEEMTTSWYHTSIERFVKYFFQRPKFSSIIALKVLWSC